MYYKEVGALFHLEVAQLLQKRPPLRKSKALILLPREHLKSSLITISYPLQRILQDPNIRILIANAVGKKAREFLDVIKRTLESERFIKLFGDYTGDSKKTGSWTQDRIITRQRTKILKEPTIEVTGAEGNLVSSHYDLIILDDIINDLTVSTGEQREKSIQWYKNVLSLLAKDGEVLINGTRWHNQDFYGWILDPTNGILEDFDVLQYGAYNEDKEVIFPALFSKPRLKELRRHQGTYTFSCQYLNRPQGEQDSFKEEWIRYYTKIPDVTYSFLTVDPALSLTKSGDYSAIMVCSMDSNRNLYVRQYIRAHLDTPDLLRAALEMYQRWGCVAMGIETDAAQRLFLPQLETVRKKLGIDVNIFALRTRSKSKDWRYRYGIGSLWPKFEEGKILIKEDMAELKEELFDFPLGRDDLLDALSYQFEIASPPEPGEKKRWQKKSIDQEYLEQLELEGVLARTDKHLGTVY